MVKVLLNIYLCSHQQNDDQLILFNYLLVYVGFNTYLHVWSLQPSNRDYDLASYTSNEGKSALTTVSHSPLFQETLEASYEATQIANIQA